MTWSLVRAGARTIHTQPHERRRRERSIAAIEARNAQKSHRLMSDGHGSKKPQLPRRSVLKKHLLHGMEAMEKTTSPHGPPKRPMHKAGIAHGGGELGNGTKSNGNKPTLNGTPGAVMSMRRESACMTGDATLTRTMAGGSADNTCNVSRLCSSRH